jgi:glycosyltransferase involved in cell wall biosynthesis
MTVMKIGIIADCYLPMRTSAAQMLHDLAIEYVDMGFQPIVIVPDEFIDAQVVSEKLSGVEIIRCRVKPYRQKGKVWRGLCEAFIPLVMIFKLIRTSNYQQNFSAIIWYSPSIFLWPLVFFMKVVNRCSAYLVLRDIFPDWAADTGLLRRGLTYALLKGVASMQYWTADVIGVQSPRSREYFLANHKVGAPVYVLHNWLGHRTALPTDIDLNTGVLAGKTIFVYAGNMGVAQGLPLIVDVIEELNSARSDIGFLFIGRGSEVSWLHQAITDRKLSNIHLVEERAPGEVASIFLQCHVGLILLDHRHQTHNIPGKLISYLRSGLPVLACVNEGNDLVELISRYQVGAAYAGTQPSEVVALICTMVDGVGNYADASSCHMLADELFSTKNAALQILHELKTV